MSAWHFPTFDTVKLYTSLTGQTLWDVSLQLFGSLEYAWELAVSNNLSVDAAIPTGTVIMYDDAGKGDRAVKNEICLKELSFVKGAVSGGDYSDDYNNDYNV